MLSNIVKIPACTKEAKKYKKKTKKIVLFYHATRSSWCPWNRGASVWIQDCVCDNWGYFVTGSKHKVRVLCYNMSDYVYSVTDQPHVVNEQYFSMEQLQPGQLVSATVSVLAERHAELTVGRFKGICSIFFIIYYLCRRQSGRIIVVHFT